MNLKGHIRLYRSIRGHWLWKNRIHVTWWMDILMEASYKSDAVNVEGRIIPCGRGQCVRSYSSWGRMWNTNYSKARRFFDLLEKDHMVSIEKVSERIIRITILNYNLYQKNMIRLSDSESNNCKGERIDLDSKSEQVIKNEEVFNQENYLEENSS